MYKQYDNMNNNLWYKPEKQYDAKERYEKHHREFINKIKNYGWQNVLNGYNQTSMWDNNTWGNNLLKSFGKDYNALLRQNLPLRQGIQYAQNNFDASYSDDNRQAPIKNNYLIGSLSQEFESGHNPAAIGYDNMGGYSYGLYQIATRPGTMREYLQYLSDSSNPKYQNFATILNSAGGDIGAMNKTSEYENAWKKLATDPVFNASQSEFIGRNRYDKVIKKIQDIQGLDLHRRHPVVSDVIRSMAVQHGNAQVPIHNALGSNSNISMWSDEDIINALYDARIDYVSNINYESPTDKRIQKNIINYRYPRERAKALKELNNIYMR